MLTLGPEAATAVVESARRVRQARAREQRAIGRLEGLFEEPDRAVGKAQIGTVFGSKQGRVRAAETRNGHREAGLSLDEHPSERERSHDKAGRRVHAQKEKWLRTEQQELCESQNESQIQKTRFE